MAEEISTLTAQTKLNWLREFEQTNFWIKVFKPWLVENQKQRLFDLMSCQLDDVTSTRAVINVIQIIEEYPESLKKILTDDIALEEHNNEAKRQEVVADN